MNLFAVLLSAAGVAAVVDWIAVAQDRRRLEYIAKPATLALLVAAAALIDAADPAQQRWFIAALILSLAGDVFLMLPRDLFVPGLASFLLAHIAYIVGFVLRGGGTPLAAAGLAAVVVVAPPVAGRILRALQSGEPRLLIPVVAYMTVISLMVVTAARTGLALAIAGAVLFYSSDALIAWNRFVRQLAWAPVAIIVTYHLAQAGLVLSLR